MGSSMKNVGKRLRMMRYHNLYTLVYCGGQETLWILENLKLMVVGVFT